MAPGQGDGEQGMGRGVVDGKPTGSMCPRLDISWTIACSRKR